MPTAAAPTAEPITPLERRAWTSPVAVVDAVPLILLAVVAAVTLFFNLGGSSALSSHEVYAAVPAREMLATGDWLIPRFGGLPRLNKPPLGYWVLAVTGVLCGELTETALRLPAALSALCLAILVGVWANRWYGRIAGYGAALAQLTSVWVVTYGRKAEIDLLLCLLTTMALFLIAGELPARSDAMKPNGAASRGRSLRWTAIYALLALSWLAKFHYGPALVLTVVATYAIVQRRLSELRLLWNPLGLMLLGAAVFVWPWLVLRQHPEAWGLWWTETVGRAVGELRVRPFWYYGPKLLWLTLPWTPLILAAIPVSWRLAWTMRDPRERFLWVWCLTQLALLTLSANKHPHYLFALLPMFSLLAGQGAARLVAWLAEHPRSLSNRVTMLGIGLVAVGSVTGWLVLHALWPHVSEAALVMMGLFGSSLCAALALYAAQRVRAGAVVLLLALLTIYGGVLGWIVPGRDDRQSTVEFARAVRAEVTPNVPVCAYRLGQHGVVFYLEPPVFREEELGDWFAGDAEQPPLFVVTSPEHLPGLEAVGPVRVLRHMTPTAPADSRDDVPLVLVELTAPLRAPDPLAERVNDTGGGQRLK